MFNLIKRALSLHKRNDYYKEILALSDINFQVNKGDRIALLGNNGSGKTTLLRIIAGLHEKTKGYLKVNGKINAFLQVGAGMEGNLTALENIFLIGAVMNLDRKIIKKNLDEIIDFAELRDFLHCPLRDFSTGMVQRLLFSLTRYGYIDADILLMDEIFLGGDIGFREKCYKVLENYMATSNTVIIATHGIEAIKRFCNKALLLDKGRQIAFGPTKEVIDFYLNQEFGKKPPPIYE